MRLYYYDCNAKLHFYWRWPQIRHYLWFLMSYRILRRIMKHQYHIVLFGKHFFLP